MLMGVATEAGRAPVVGVVPIDFCGPRITEPQGHELPVLLKY